MCLESVFSALGGWLLLHQNLSFRNLPAAMLLFAAVVLAQPPWPPDAVQGLRCPAKPCAQLRSVEGIQYELVRKKVKAAASAGAQQRHRDGKHPPDGQSGTG